MNSFCRQVNALLLCAAVFTITPVYSMEIEVADPVEIAHVEIEDASPELSQVWYKKRSAQMVMALTTAAAAYAFLVRMDKMVSPLAFASVLFTSFAATSVSSPDLNDNNAPQIPQQASDNIGQDNHDASQDSNMPQDSNDAPQMNENIVHNIVQKDVVVHSQLRGLVNVVNSFFVKCRDNAPSIAITEQDFRNMHDTLSR